MSGIINKTDDRHPENPKYKGVENKPEDKVVKTKEAPKEIPKEKEGK